jgi:hypothetical protein
MTTPAIIDVERERTKLSAIPKARKAGLLR